MLYHNIKKISNNFSNKIFKKIKTFIFKISLFWAHDPIIFLLEIILKLIYIYFKLFINNVIHKRVAYISELLIFSTTLNKTAYKRS